MGCSSGIRIIATVRCAPPANRPTTEEKATCSGWLDRDLELSRSRPACGRCSPSAPSAGTRRSARPGGSGGRCRGPRRASATARRRCFAGPDGHEVRLVGSYHVSQQNTFTGKLTEAMLDDVLTGSERWLGHRSPEGEEPDLPHDGAGGDVGSLAHRIPCGAHPVVVVDVVRGPAGPLARSIGTPARRSPPVARPWWLPSMKA